MLWYSSSCFCRWSLWMVCSVMNWMMLMDRCRLSSAAVAMVSFASMSSNYVYWPVFPSLYGLPSFWHSSVASILGDRLHFLLCMEVGLWHRWKLRYSNPPTRPIAITMKITINRCTTPTQTVFFRLLNMFLIYLIDRFWNGQK